MTDEPLKMDKPSLIDETFIITDITTDNAQITKELKNLYSKFLFIWFGQFISIIGTGLTIFSLGVYVFQKTNTASSYVFILMCVFLPSLLLKPMEVYWQTVMTDA